MPEAHGEPNGQSDAQWILQTCSRIWGLVFRALGIKKVLIGSPNREPQEYSRNIVEEKDPGR